MWLFCFSIQEGGEFIPRDEKGNVLYSNVDYVDTWKASRDYTYLVNWSSDYIILDVLKDFEFFCNDIKFNDLYILTSCIPT